MPNFVLARINNNGQITIFDSRYNAGVVSKLVLAK